MADDKESNNYTLTSSFTLFLLWVIVYSNTNVETFKLISSKTYYSFAEFSTFGNLGTFIGIFIMAWLAVVTDKSENSTCQYITAAFAFLISAFILGAAIYQIVLLGTIMHNDIQHTFFGYSAFWSEGAMNFNKLESYINVNNSNYTIQSTKRHLTNNTYNTPRLRNGNLNYTDNRIYNIEMSRYYNKPLLCDFKNNCNDGIINTYSNAINRAYKHYWKNYYNDLSQYDLTGKFPKHIIAQTKLAIDDLFYGNKPSSGIIVPRHLTENPNTTNIKRWPYIMADILIRIMSFSIFFIAFTLALLITCGGSAYAFGELCKTRN